MSMNLWIFTTHSFNSTDHHILLHCLDSSIGIPGTGLAWFTSYLISRTEYVYLGDAKSHTYSVTCGLMKICLFCNFLHGPFRVWYTLWGAVIVCLSTLSFRAVPPLSVSALFQIQPHPFHSTPMTHNSTSKQTQSPLQPYPQFLPAWRILSMDDS